MYLEVIWDSVIMWAQLSAAHVKTILNTLSHIRLGQDITVYQFQRILGLVAATSKVIPYGPSAHETASVVALTQGISSKGQSPKANKGYMLQATYTFCVTQTPVSQLLSHSRCVLSLQDANDGRLHLGLGSSLRWPSSPRVLGGIILIGTSTVSRL